VSRNLRLGLPAAGSTHRIDAAGELRLLNDRNGSPRGHRKQVTIVGNDEDRSASESELEAPVVFVVRTVVHVDVGFDDTTARRIGNFGEYSEVFERAIARPAKLSKDSCGVRHDVWTKPQTKLLCVVDDPQTVRGQVASQWWWTRPGPESVRTTCHGGYEDIYVECDRLSRCGSHFLVGVESTCFTRSGIWSGDKPLAASRSAPYSDRSSSRSARSSTSMCLMAARRNALRFPCPNRATKR
jgi:hypothetical protein